MTTIQQHSYAHRGAGTRVSRTTYAVVNTRAVLRAASTVIVFALVIGVWAWLGTMDNPCKAVTVESFAQSADLASQGWTVASGETMIPPHCA